MAKIRFNDYIKSNQKRAKVYESEEALVERARAKMSVDPMVVSPAYRVQNLEAAEALLKDSLDFPGASDLYGDCQDKLREAKRGKKEADYERAVLHLSEAGDEHEYEKAAAEFAALSDYKDAARKTEEAKAQVRRLSVKARVLHLFVLALILALAFGAYKAYRAGYLSYLAGRMEGLGGRYKDASMRLSGLNLLDSREQADKYKALALRQRESQERQSLPEAEKGDTVTFGGQSWLVLDREGDQALLICLSPSRDSRYRNLPYDQEGGSGRWEDSSLRAYLNGEGLSDFTDLEREALVPMTGASSEQEGRGAPRQDGSLTDLVRILGPEDLDRYAEVYEKPGVDMWLASPGKEEGSAAFQTTSGTVFRYGNDVTDDRLSACPVITVDLAKMQKAAG